MAGSPKAVINKSKIRKRLGIKGGNPKDLEEESSERKKVASFQSSDVDDDDSLEASDDNYYIAAAHEICPINVAPLSD